MQCDMKNENAMSTKAEIINRAAEITDGPRKQFAHNTFMAGKAGRRMAMSSSSRMVARLAMYLLIFSSCLENISCRPVPFQVRDAASSRDLPLIPVTRDIDPELSPNINTNIIHSSTNNKHDDDNNYNDVSENSHRKMLRITNEDRPPYKILINPFVLVLAPTDQMLLEMDIQILHDVAQNVMVQSLKNKVDSSAFFLLDSAKFAGEAEVFWKKAGGRRRMGIKENKDDSRHLMSRTIVTMAGGEAEFISSPFTDPPSEKELNEAVIQAMEEGLLQALQQSAGGEFPFETLTSLLVSKVTAEPSSAPFEITSLPSSLPTSFTTTEPTTEPSTGPTTRYSTPSPTEKVPIAISAQGAHISEEESSSSTKSDPLPIVFGSVGGIALIAASALFVKRRRHVSSKRGRRNMGDRIIPTIHSHSNNNQDGDADDDDDLSSYAPEMMKGKIAKHDSQRLYNTASLTLGQVTDLDHDRSQQQQYQSTSVPSPSIPRKEQHRFKMCSPISPINNTNVQRSTSFSTTGSCWSDDDVTEWSQSTATQSLSTCTSPVSALSPSSLQSGNGVRNNLSREESFEIQRNLKLMNVQKDMMYCDHTADASPKSWLFSINNNDTGSKNMKNCHNSGAYVHYNMFGPGTNIGTLGVPNNKRNAYEKNGDSVLAPTDFNASGIVKSHQQQQETRQMRQQNHQQERVQNHQSSMKEQVCQGNIHRPPSIFQRSRSSSRSRSVGRRAFNLSNSNRSIDGARHQNINDNSSDCDEYDLEPDKNWDPNDNDADSNYDAVAGMDMIPFSYEDEMMNNATAVEYHSFT